MSLELVPTVVGEVVGEVLDPGTAAYWYPTLSLKLREGVQWVVEFGRSLAEAKAALNYGEWLPLLERIELGNKTALRFMTIGSHQVLSNGAHVHHLPPSWGTLYELSKAEPKALEAAIESGEVNPSTTRAEAVKVVKGDTDTKPGSKGRPKPEEKKLGLVATFVREDGTIPAMTVEDVIRHSTTGEQSASMLRRGIITRFGSMAAFNKLAKAADDKQAVLDNRVSVALLGR
jgi:hypothetical protein